MFRRYVLDGCWLVPSAVIGGVGLYNSYWAGLPKGILTHKSECFYLGMAVIGLGSAAGFFVYARHRRANY